MVLAQNVLYHNNFQGRICYTTLWCHCEWAQTCGTYACGSV